MYANGARAKYIHINLLQLYKFFFLTAVVFLSINKLYAQGEIQLSPPQAESPAVYFQQSTCISFEFRQQGAVIRYTLNDEEPDENSSIYKEPICVSRSVVIKVKSYATGFIPSSTIGVQCIKTGGAIESITGSLPDAPYNRNGLDILIDGKAGVNSFNNDWLGFQKDSLQWKIKFNKKYKPGKIYIGLMQAQSSWIFYPFKIEIVSSNGKQLGVKNLTASATQLPDEKRVFSFSIKKKITGFEIRINNLTSLPGWHPGKGNKPWLFIDEISAD